MKAKKLLLGMQTFRDAQKPVSTMVTRDINYCNNQKK